MNIFLALLMIGITWFVLDQVVYSPKARIKRLWKKIFCYAREEGKLRKKVGDSDPFIWDNLFSTYKKEQERNGKLINALLEYHFGLNEDEEEYVSENRYERN